MRIPREDISLMIDLCFENISQFLLDAELIHLQSPRFDHSIAFVQFAIEELGKAGILRKRLLETTDDVVEVSDAVFGRVRGSHRLKENEAWTILSLELRVLARAAFDPEFFDPRFFVTQDVKLSHEERLRSLFVDFIDGTPTLGAAAEKERLTNIITSMKEEVETLKMSWSIAE